MNAMNDAAKFYKTSVGRLSKDLTPFKEIIGGIASYLTIAQFFSGAFICYDIKKQGSTKNITSVPFVGGIMMGLVMLKYGLMLNDGIMLQVNFAAIGLNIIYSIFYYIYATDKWNEILKQLAISMGIVAVLWGYAGWERKEVVEDRYGLIITVLMLALLGSPLRGVKDMIAKKDASQIPFVLTFMGALVTLTWLLYSIILQNDFMIVQNVLGFLLCFVQLILIFAFPGLTQDIAGDD